MSEYVLGYPKISQDIRCTSIYPVYTKFTKTNGQQNAFFIFDCRRQWKYAWNMYACEFNHDKNALRYEELYFKLGVVCTGIFQDILVNTGKYRYIMS